MSLALMKLNEDRSIFSSFVEKANISEKFSIFIAFSLEGKITSTRFVQL